MYLYKKYNVIIKHTGVNKLSFLKDYIYVLFAIRITQLINERRFNLL